MTLQGAWMEDGGSEGRREREKQVQEAAGTTGSFRSRNQWPSDSLPAAKP